MVLIVGIATTAAGALVVYRKVQNGDFGEPGEVIRTVRQTTGVVLAVANFIRNMLDALQLINRPRPAAIAAGASAMRIIGARAGDDD